MRILSFFLVGIVLIVIQTSIFQFIPSWLGSPDLIFILIAFSAYRFDWLHGLVLVVIFSWIMDVVSGLYLGTYPLLYLFLFVFLKVFKENSPVKEVAYQIPLVGIVFFIGHSCLYSFYSLAVPDVLPEWSWVTILQETFVLIVATIPCFLLYNSLFEHMSQRRFVPPRILRKRSGNYFR
jgi:rod shape-determining protein MreD